MKIDQVGFLHLLDDKVYRVLVEISRRGFCLTLVGGAVRDYLLTGELSHDLDFEIKHKFLYDEDEWKRKLDALFSHLSSFDNSLEIRELKYNIFRVKLNDFELEFSSTRIEKINEDQGHNYFDPVFISNLSSEEAFSRRDLTVNAIGIFFGVPGSEEEFSLVDPYGGIDDLNDKLLRNINDNFFFDYVRLLRLLRFKNVLGFNICEDLYKELGRFNLSRATNHYIFYEFKKCFHSKDPLNFLNDLFSIIDSFKIETNEVLECFRPLAQVSVEDSKYKISDDFLSWLAAHEALTQDQKLLVVKTMMFSQKKFKKLLKQ